jgi:glycosyltransferase involved in cell wall biosynthesis
LELAIAFEHSDKIFKKIQNYVTYYPIQEMKRLKAKILFKLDNSQEEKHIIPHCVKIINDFKPDVIHIFGSEWCYGLVQQYTQIPVVIHLQGCCPPYNNAKTPGAGILEKWRALCWNPYKLLQCIKKSFFPNQRALREERILRMTKHFMGRTEWDKALVRLYAPQAQYHYCAEVLRQEFANAEETWAWRDRNQMILITTGSAVPLKGIDVVLKTAELLKKHSNINFEWRLAGTKNIHFFERFTGIRSNQVNVVPIGVLSASELKQQLLNADIYVHPSYADNSPKSLCEAQRMGVPVIASAVGGIPSLVKNDETGLLVAANDPYMLASQIIWLHQNRQEAERLGSNARAISINRHSSENIIYKLKTIYDDLLKDSSQKNDSEAEPCP